MDKKEFEEKMQEILANSDPEKRHIRADNLLCRTLNELEYKDGVETFRKMNKWYS